MWVTAERRSMLQEDHAAHLIEDMTKSLQIDTTWIDTTWTDTNTWIDTKTCVPDTDRGDGSHVVVASMFVCIGRNALSDAGENGKGTGSKRTDIRSVAAVIIGGVAIGDGSGRIGR